MNGELGYVPVGNCWVILTEAEVPTAIPLETPFEVIGPFIAILFGESYKNEFPELDNPEYFATTKVVRGTPYVGIEAVAPILHACNALFVKKAGYDELKFVALHWYPAVVAPVVVVTIVLFNTLLS